MCVCVCLDGGGCVSVCVCVDRGGCVCVCILKDMHCLIKDSCPVLLKVV